MEIIDKSLLLIVYRWIWQSKINDVNKDYIYRNKTLSSLTQGDEIKMFLGCHTLTLNYRDISQTTLMVIDDIPSLPIFSVRNRQIAAIYYGAIATLPENYVFTSTKYLREIKESGINCLSIIDNV